MLPYNCLTFGFYQMMDAEKPSSHLLSFLGWTDVILILAHFTTFLHTHTVHSALIRCHYFKITFIQFILQYMVPVEVGFIL